MPLISTKKMNQIIANAREEAEIASMFLSSKKVSSINKFVDVLDNLIQIIIDHKYHVNDILNSINQEYHNDNSLDKAYIEKLAKKIESKNNSYYFLLNTQIEDKEQLIKIHTFLKYYYLLVKKFKSLKKDNHERQFFKIDDLIQNLDDKIKEIKNIIFQMINGEKISKISRIKAPKFTKNNHIIPTSYYQKWINKRKTSRNDYIPIHTHLTPIAQYILDTRHKRKKLNNFSVYLVNLIIKISKRNIIQLKPIKLDNFMAKENWLEQELENNFTNYKHAGFTFSTEKIDFLEKIYDEVENNKIDFFLHIEDKKVVDYQINPKNQITTGKLDYRFEAKLKQLHNLNSFPLSFIQLDFFTKFLIGRRIFSHFCFLSRINKDLENNTYYFEYINLIPARYTYFILNRIKKTPEQFPDTIKYISSLIGKGENESLNLMIKASQGFSINYYDEIKAKKEFLINDYTKKIKQLKKFTKSKKLKAEIHNSTSITNKFFLKNKINDFKKQITHPKTNDLFLDIQSLINTSMQYDEIDFAWLDSELSSSINTFFLNDLINYTKNYVFNDYLIITTAGRKLPTSDTPVILSKINSYPVLFLAYTPDIIIINAHTNIIAYFKKLIQSGNRNTIFDYYENHIRKYAQTLIEFQ